MTRLVKQVPAISALVLALMVALIAAPPAQAAARQESSDAFASMTSHYEAIHQALLRDSLEGVAQNARAIRDRAVVLAERFSAEAAGVPAGSAADVKALLPEIAKHARSLAAATDLAGARAALGELTKPLVRYRALAGDTSTTVAYCPMAKKAWLQKRGEAIGNPYYGQEMPRCGSFVAK